MARYAIMKAQQIIRERFNYPDGAFAEVVIWKVPRSVAGSVHMFKYRLVYIVGGERIIGYDNERGKGDHCHYMDKEVRFNFSSIDDLLSRFSDDVQRVRKGA